MPRKAKPVGDTAASPEDGKRHPLNIRTTRHLREQLEAAANRSGRSLAQEMEIRLERSFADERLQGGAHNFALARLIASAVSIAETTMGRSWTDSETVKESCRNAAMKAVEIAFGKEIAEGTGDVSRIRSIGEFSAVIADQEATNAEFETAGWQERLDQAQTTLITRALSNVGTLVAPRGLLSPVTPPLERPRKRKTNRGSE